MSEHGIKHSRSQGAVDFAYRFAKEAHGDQLRKYTNEPYITHPVAVAHMVAKVTEDVDMICAALMHDVIEDTDRTFEDIRDAGFGYRCASLVRQVSDVSKPEDGNRAKRKEKDRLHLAIASPEAKTIKLADLIHNSASITKHDPGFAEIYMGEKLDLLHVLTEGDQTLWKKAFDIVYDYYSDNPEIALIFPKEGL